MSGNEAVLSALDAVEDDDRDDHADADPGAGNVSMGEEPDAMPEGPMPDADAPDVEDESGFSVLSWASRVPDGSHLDFEAKDWWDPETGGKRRLAYHLSDATPEGAGYNNVLGTLVAAGEMYWSAVRDQTGQGDGGDPQESAPDAETVARDTAEGLV